MTSITPTVLRGTPTSPAPAAAATVVAPQAVAAPAAASSTPSNNGGSYVWTPAPSSWGPDKFTTPYSAIPGGYITHNAAAGTYRVNDAAGQQGPLESTISAAISAWNVLFGAVTPVASLPAPTPVAAPTAAAPPAAGNGNGILPSSPLSNPGVSQGVGGAGSGVGLPTIPTLPTLGGNVSQTPSSDGSSGGGTSNGGTSALDEELLAALGSQGSDNGAAQSPTTEPVYPAAQEIYGAAGSGTTTSNPASVAVIIIIAVLLIGVGYYIYERYRAKQKVDVGGAKPDAGGDKKNFLEKLF